MDKEVIEKAADNYAATAKPSYFNGDFDKHAIADAFERGALWRINAAWHDARKEQPNLWKLLIRKDRGGDFDLGYEIKTDTVYWAYVADLLPELKKGGDQ